MIKLIVFDIDGVITDGTVIVDVNGTEQKKLNLKDVDAIYELHKQGYKLAAITGENTEIVSYFEKRFPWDYFFRGAKQKTDIIREIQDKGSFQAEEICYVGDGKYDVEPLAYVGLGICPADAIDRAKQAAGMILQKEGGQGCLWELIRILQNYNDTEQPVNYFYQRLEEHEDIFKRMATDTDLTENVMTVAEQICSMFREGGQLFLCGNGGSAADAQHIATEFVSRFYKERPAMNAEALTVNTSTLTAIGNDYSYERVFARQLEAKAKKGDMLIAISTSGTSKNVLEALRHAKREGIITVMLMGQHDVPELRDICDYILKVPSKITPRVQEAHIFIGHTIAEYVEHKLFGGTKNAGIAKQI